MSASRYENQIVSLTTRLQKAEKELAKRDAKIAVIRKLATDTAGDADTILRLICAELAK